MSATRVAAVQLQPRLGDVDANLEACARLVAEAVADGAAWVALPEFFTTGMAFLPAIEHGVLPFDGAATGLLVDQAREHGIHVGGSFLCRDDDGQVRNAFVLAGPDGVLGRHDKDLPTMWENAFYVGGTDDGLLDAGWCMVGVGLCWELIRARTVRRLRERCDLVLGGSAWWSVPDWPPRAVTRRWARANAVNAEQAPRAFARLIGAPVVHAAHAGPLACPLPWMPLGYRGRYEGGAVIADADGRVLARRPTAHGSGIVVADVELGARPAADPAPAEGTWLVERGPVPTLAWHLQRAHGRRHYAAAHREARYVTAAGHPALTGLYDATIALTMRERRFRGALAERLLATGGGDGPAGAARGGDGPATGGDPAARRDGGLDVVDVGAGTGTLAIALAARGARVVAVDGDDDVLARARAKPGAGRVRWLTARADALPLADASADRVVLSLVLHHLSDAAKDAALREARRVLRPGGRLHVADWGRPRDPAMRAAFGLLRLIDGRANTRSHAEGRLPALIAAAGFGTVAVDERLRTAWGQLELLTARP